MKKYGIWLVLALALMGLCACGGGAVPAAEPETEEPVAFGTAVEAEAPEALSESAEEQEAFGQEEPAGPGSVQEDEGQAAAQAPEADWTESAVFSVTAAMCLGDVRYDPEESGFFWQSVAYLTIRMGENVPGAEVTEEAIRIPASSVDLLAEALFGPYENQYPSLGEENPYVAQEYVDGAEIYVVTRRDLSELTVDWSEPETQADGTGVCEVTAERPDEPVVRYRLTLAECRGDAARLFRYCVVDAERSEGAE